MRASEFYICALKFYMRAPKLYMRVAKFYMRARKFYMRAQNLSIRTYLMYLYAAKFYLEQKRLYGGEISYIFFYFLYINSQFHYKYAGLFFVQMDHHRPATRCALAKHIAINLPFSQHKLPCIFGLHILSSAISLHLHLPIARRSASCHGINTLLTSHTTWPDIHRPAP